MDTKRICLWSGPRNVSTALMYSFAQRPGTRVIDEPLYAHYLRVSGVDHPGRERIIASQDNDGERVIADVILGDTADGTIFVKNMAHHLVDVSWDFLERTANVILTRAPAQVLPSLARKLPDPRIDDTGFPVQVRLVEHLASIGQNVVVIDARELLADPESVLRQVCERISIPFVKAMLHWPSGPRPEDGVWSDIWYHDVHTTTGFAPYRPKTTPLPPKLGPLLVECEPYYARLSELAIRATPSAHTSVRPVTIEKAQRSDVARVNELLSAASLPVDGIEDVFDTLLVAKRGNVLVGAAAIEIHGSQALLRSVVVASSEQSDGVGARLVRDAVESAASLGISEVVLLTTDASDYFKRFGFEAVSRESISGPVIESREFTTLCPSTATAMRLLLSGSHGLADR
ncbi:MAG: GNAT family N-acetyltransferase [Rhodothermales bacterium]|nr:GNAT family N-acetyltransferase [Rhodothermales bacterium]